ncbi:hypothetical protein ACFL4W_01335 [Planctomycetota bacterium]
MQTEEYTCAKCGKALLQEDMNQGKGGLVKGKAYCREHYFELMKMTALKTQFIDEKGREITPEG